MMSGSAALRVDELRKCYGAIEAVAGLSFVVKEGEIFGLLGPNGAGKTTTVAMLATQRTPSSGDAQVLGHSIRREPHLVRRMIGVAPQGIALYPRLTAAENICFFGRMYGINGNELQGRVDQVLEIVGLKNHRDLHVDTFSGGMQRRLNLAIALVHRPRLLLLDEPTVGVDAQTRYSVFETIRRLRDNGSAIVYTTHYMEEAEALCDRLGIMDKGKMIAMGTLRELMDKTNYAETIEIRGLDHPADLSAIQSRPGVLRIDSSNGLIRLHVDNAAGLLEVLRQLIDASSRPVHVKITPPSLEQFFLFLTGKELRD